MLAWWFVRATGIGWGGLLLILIGVAVSYELLVAVQLFVFGFLLQSLSDAFELLSGVFYPRLWPVVNKVLW
jgi:hypothetical protein